MGDISDYYRDQEEMFGDYMDDRIPITHSLPFTWWSQGDGTRIRRKNMTVIHLKNSIAMIERKGNWRENWLPILKEELKSRK